ncbi:MAG TPA: chromate transporter [Beijerinckiaceae bacterium]|nr:chromate transporter [Beijerinckiaceae bacterium]
MAEISPPASDARPSLLELAVGFLEIGLLGFGGVAPIARHVIVEKRRWLDDRDYAAVLALGQILPGANTVNASILIGDRFRGLQGAVVSCAALLTMPVIVLAAIIVVYDRFQALPDVHAAMLGIAATAAGLVIGTSLKLARGIKPDFLGIAACLATFAAVGLLRLPLVPVVLVAVPCSVALAIWTRR